MSATAFRAYRPMPLADAVFLDRHGQRSSMCWVPEFTANVALTTATAAATPSGTAGDWFLPIYCPSKAVKGIDYEAVTLGGWFVDRYLCSACDASAHSRGTVADGTPRSPHYVSQVNVAPMVDLPIGHFKTYLRARFDGGQFLGTEGELPGSGGLLPDACWNQLWMWGRLSGLSFHGNTDHGHGFHDPQEHGLHDPTTEHGTLTGSGPSSWQQPIDDFTGNRAEFTDGLRLLDGIIHTAGRAVDPPNDVRDAAYLNTGLRIAGVEPGQSVASYRLEPSLREHSMGASGTAAGEGGMAGQGLFYNSGGERVADRGSGWGLRELAPGKLSLGKAPDGFGDRVGARAIFVPEDVSTAAAWMAFATRPNQ